jgi:hypothetical protein
VVVDRLWSRELSLPNEQLAAPRRRACLLVLSATLERVRCGCEPVGRSPPPAEMSGVPWPCRRLARSQPGPHRDEEGTGPLPEAGSRKARDRAQGRIAELEQELHDRPTRPVHHWVDQDELEKAREEAQRAFRSRENAWQALCEIRLLHREGQAGQCRCGLRLDRCKIVQIVDHYPALEKWEKEQLSRVRGGLTHNLPEGHPAVLDRNWQP